MRLAVRIAPLRVVPVCVCGWRGTARDSLHEATLLAEMTAHYREHMRQDNAGRVITLEPVTDAR